MPGKTDSKPTATAKADTKTTATANTKTTATGKAGTTAKGAQREVTVRSKQRAAIAFKIGVFRSSFVLLLSIGMLVLGIITGNKCDKMDNETAKFLMYAGIAGIFLFGFGMAKSLVILCYRKGSSCCDTEYTSMTKRRDMALMSWFDVFSMFPVAAWLAWGTYRVYNDYSRFDCMNKDTGIGNKAICEYCTVFVLKSAQGLVGAGWVMFLITGVMTILAVYFLPNNSLVFEPTMKGYMNA